MEFLRHLHPVLVLGALVGIFLALQRHSPSSRVRFWLAGWTLIFVHFFLRLLPLAPGTAAFWLATAFDYTAVPFGGIMFLISVSVVCDQPAARTRLLLLLGLPTVVLSVALAWGVSSPWVAMLCLAVLAYGGAAWYVLWFRRWTAWVGGMVAFLTVFGAWTIYRVWRDGIEFGYLAALLVIYGLTGALFWRRYARLSPGVITTVVGFILWAGVWGGAAFFQEAVGRIGFESELWNVPKLLVAFGMIVTLLENQRLAAQEAGERARLAGLQIQRFADVTSRLLGGVEVASLCGHIAQVITESTVFERVVIFLGDDQRRLYIAGHAGVAAEVVEQLRQAVSGHTTDAVNELCAHGRHVAQNSFICAAGAMRPYGAVSSTRRYEPNPSWNDGDEALVPLRSPRGMVVGCISLDDPRDVTRLSPAELSKIEMLAADLAVAIENASLQRQLVVSEKLAAIGQLVAGVAHELNNPLTAVMGYAEVLAERAPDDRTHRDLGVIHREGLRMKRIIENLLRFAQQNKSERKQVSLLPLIEEVLHLRAYEVRNRGVQLVTRVPATLPKVAGDENQLKQVFLNVLSNALDAVEDTADKCVTIEGRVQGDRVLLTFVDSGPGFSDLNRVFDPFFTTKPVGKGTGLGLSICYGILKEHGGDIYAYNVHPAGACIAMEIPIAAEELARAAATEGS